MCPVCQNSRHVASEAGGYKRCPECFVQASLERVLAHHGYPGQWADASVDAIAKVLGSEHLLVSTLQNLFDGTATAVHFYGPPSSSREAVFAACLRGFLGKWPQINILDTGELAPKHFEKDRQMLHFKAAPTVLTVGKEIEKKTGSYYLRHSLEFAVPRRLPVVLFSDADYGGLQAFYGDFSALYSYAGFVPVLIPQ